MRNKIILSAQGKWCSVINRISSGIFNLSQMMDADTKLVKPILHQSMCTYYVRDKQLFLIFSPLCRSLSLCCFSPVWHLNSKAALKWRWMAELPHTINKASYVCLREGHVLYTILSLFRAVTVHSLILCDKNTVGCSKWHSTVFIRAYAVLHEWFNRICIV